MLQCSLTNGEAQFRNGSAITICNPHIAFTIHVTTVLVPQRRAGEGSLPRSVLG